MNYTYSFEKLSVWQMNRVFTKKLYRQTAAFPKEELFGITAQIRRASISISCNLAEGSARISAKEQFRFYEIAFGSGIEVGVFRKLCQSKSFELLGSQNSFFVG